MNGKKQVIKDHLKNAIDMQQENHHGGILKMKEHMLKYPLSFLIGSLAKNAMK
jgi:hypothetical protein